MLTDRHTNRLINETSPYLLQHAHNPVNWYPWSEEVLQLAKSSDKPILVSIGYSACHWCHVMERESFEDEEIASIMNREFINVKIDREERPDLDNIYMEAVQLIAGNGGWPLNVFLTPEGKPFYGGTYFPPKPAFNRASWPDVLIAIADAWKNKRDEISQQANDLTNHIGRKDRIINPSVQSSSEIQDYSELVHTIAGNLLKTADKEEGGFGRPPKFPQFALIRYLLAFGHFKKNEEARSHAHFSLLKMIRGGIYDQVGGGLCRYSVDGEWLVPHFEKMLYDNALFLETLAEAYQESKNEEYKIVAYQTLDWLEREMKSAEAGYISALDADSEGVEGKYYTWSVDEFEQIAGADAEWMKNYFSATEKGNFEHTNILSRKQGFPEDVEKRNAYLRLLDAMQLERSKRIAPGKDDKILLGWNALLVRGIFKCGFAFGDDSLVKRGMNLFHFLRDKFYSEQEGLKHSYKNGVAGIPAFLDDYAYLIDAGITYLSAELDSEILDFLITLTDKVIETFWDEDSGVFYFTSIQQTDIITRKIELFDGAQPSGNSVMLANLERLYSLTDRSEYQEKAQIMGKGLLDTVWKYPNSFGNWSLQYLARETGRSEIVVTGLTASEIRAEILTAYLPFDMVISAEVEQPGALMKGKSFGSSAAIYLCHRQFCYAPVNGVKELENLLKKAKG